MNWTAIAEYSLLAICGVLLVSWGMGLVLDSLLGDE